MSTSNYQKNCKYRPFFRVWGLAPVAGQRPRNTLTDSVWTASPTSWLDIDPVNWVRWATSCAFPVPLASKIGPLRQPCGWPHFQHEGVVQTKPPATPRVAVAQSNILVHLAQ